MKCPNCRAELMKTDRHGVDADYCPACHGMWLSRQELERLEDQAFDLGGDEKGMLVFSSSLTARSCPECSGALRMFHYRLYDLELDYCPAGHGYWLDVNEDTRLMELMKLEEARLKRTGRAELRWAAHLKRLRSGSVFQIIRGLLS
jgi:Zn-finger nucleic acid-binding protein